jgi:hypothetical protein
MQVKTVNKLILVGVAACALSAPVAAQTPPFTPVGPAVLAGQGYQYASNDIAYDDKQDVYLMVQGHTFAGGRFVNANGQLIGTQFDIARQSGSDAESRVAYSAGSADDVFLVTFRSELGGGTQIYGRLVTYAGGNPSLGPLLGITELSTPRPGRQVNGGIAFDPIRRQFLVTWEDWRFGLPRVMGRLWALSGAASAPTLVPATGDFTIGNDIAGSPNVAYDTVHNIYMVVYRGPHPSNGAISGSFGRMVAFSGGQPQVSAFIELTAGNGEPGEQNVIYLPETDNFLAIWTDITNVRDVSGRVVNHAGAAVTGVFPLLNTPSNEGAADLGYSPTTHSILLAAMRDQTKRIQGVQLTAAGALTDSYFLASTALPGSGLESFFPNVAPAENGRFGLSYVNDYQYGWVEVLQGSGVTGGPPPPPPPPGCAVEPLPSATTVNLGGAAETRTITVTASTADCPWTATSSASWLTITAGASGAGPGTTTYAVTRNSSGATRSATVTIGSGRVTVNQAPSLTNAALHDISGARASDITWHNISTGQVAVWDVEGWTVKNAYNLWNPVATSWRVVGTGDLDGDGFADVVWRHSSGTVAAWFLRSGAIVGAQVLSLDGAAAVESDASWEIRAVGDLDGDGKCDIIWQNMSVGTLGVWYMNGGTVRARASFNMGMADANWKIAGAGDLNLDGKADIIWQNHATGFLGAWAMDGHTVIWTGNLAPTSDTRIADTNWKIRGVGDTNGDGFADLIWQNMSTGDVGVWFLRYVTVLEKRPLTIPRVAEPSKWHIVGPG